MTKQTSANMQPCKGGAAERHNRRDKELDYIRKDLTPLNSYKEWTSIESQMAKIRTEYEATTGQKLQATSQPIQEIVLVIDKGTTPEQVERFCDLCRTLGMTPLSYAIHKDEGHIDTQTSQWVPNYHAHIVVDTTCWEHRKVERTKKKNGKNVIDPKTHKPAKITVDAYAKTIKFTREDMSRLQDFAAEATGLERGVSSDRIHEEARQFKAHEQAREIERQAKAIEEQKALLERQGYASEENITAIAAQEHIMRQSASEMQKKGKDVVRNFDEQNGRLSNYKLTPDKKLIQWRDWLDKTSRDDLSTAPVSKIIQIIQPLSNAITIVAMAAAAMASALASSLAKTISEKEKVLAALTRQIKEQSVWKSTKGAFLSLIDKPASKQAEVLLSEVESAKAEVEASKKDSMAKDAKISSLESANTNLREELSRIKTSCSAAVNQRDDLKSRLKEAESHLAEKDKILKTCYQHFVNIAEDLVDHASVGLLQRYEARGLHKQVGENIWRVAKETMEERSAERTGQQQVSEQPRSKGRRM